MRKVLTRPPATVPPLRPQTATADPVAVVVPMPEAFTNTTDRRLALDLLSLIDTHWPAITADAARHPTPSATDYMASRRAELLRRQAHDRAQREATP